MWSVKRLLILLFSRRKFWQKELHNIFKSNLRTDITFQDARYKIYHNVRWIITCHNCQTQEVLRIWDAPRRVARQDRYGQPTLPEETSVRSVSPEIKETIMCKVWNETIPANGVLRKFAWKTKSDFYEMVPFQVIQIWDYIAFYRTKIVIWTISWLVKIFFKCTHIKDFDESIAGTGGQSSAVEIELCIVNHISVSCVHARSQRGLEKATI